MLCLNKKLDIASCLNKRPELISKSREQNKFTLLRNDSKE